MAAATPYPFSLSIDPYRPISSYFPLASTSHSHSPPPANERQQRQPPTSPEPFVDARHVDQASRSASYKRPSSSPHRARHDEPAAPGKRPRMRPALEPVGSAFEGGSSASHDPELALPDEFSPGALKPKLSGLRFDYYKPYLLDEPVAPAWSSTFCEAFIAFAMSVAPPPLWSGRPERLRVDDDSPGILRDIRSREPDAEAFRRRAPLNRSRAAERAAPDLMAKLVAMLDVMRWIWDDDSLELEHVAGMILTAPLAVFMISASRSPSLLPLHLASAERAHSPDASSLPLSPSHPSLHILPLAPLPSPSPHPRRDAALLDPAPHRRGGPRAVPLAAPLALVPRARRARPPKLVRARRRAARPQVPVLRRPARAAEAGKGGRGHVGGVVGAARARRDREERARARRVGDGRRQARGMA